MLIRCAWCKRTLGDKPPYGGKYDKEITDGICDDCLAKHFPSVYGKVEALKVSEQDRYPDYTLRTKQ